MRSFSDMALPSWLPILQHAADIQETFKLEIRGSRYRHIIETTYFLSAEAEPAPEVFESLDMILVNLSRSCSPPKGLMWKNDLCR